MNEIILSAKNIKKSFGPVKALRNASINFYKGKVNMLFGENGAGKSTLMNIVSGLLQPDEGDILINNEKVVISNIQNATRLGIQFIHQEIKLAEDLSVAENIFLSNLKTKFGFLNYRQMNLEAKKILDSLGVEISPSALVNTLSIAEKQMIEIAKALSKKAKILIMDEPTSSIGEKETQNLFKIVHELKKQQIAIVYITHRMKEIQEIADYITIFRDGMFVGEYLNNELSEDEIITKMVGRELTEQFPKKIELQKEPVLIINKLNNSFVTDINLTINKSEILVLSGLVGSGRTELAKTIISEIKKTSGSFIYKGQNVSFNSISKAISSGIFYISEDRKKEGILLDLPIDFNITLSSLKKIVNQTNFFTSTKIEKQFANSFIEKLKIRCHDGNQIVGTLSGGNQQKVAIAKGLMTKPNVIIFDEPTRGVDVGARKEIYEIMYELKKQEVAVVVISSDLQEVLGIADRIVVMANGRITADLENANLTQEDIMQNAFKFEG